MQSPSTTPPSTGGSFRPDLLAGKVALITGGGTGIGAGLARALAGHGADVVLASRRRSHLDPVAAEIEELGRRALVCEMDVRERSACDRTVAEALEKFGRLDLLVNNAAGNFLAKAAKLPEKAWRTVIDVVLNGTFNMSQAAYAALRQTRGAIVNVTATYSGSSAPFMAHSGAAKAGVLNFTRSLAAEWGPDGIRVNAVAPGLVEGTEGAKRLVESVRMVDVYRKQVPLGRLAQTDDVAQVVLFLASPAAAFVTGVEITVDGGVFVGGQMRDALEALERFVV